MSGNNKETKEVIDKFIKWYNELEIDDQLIVRYRLRQKLDMPVK